MYQHSWRFLLVSSKAQKSSLYCQIQMEACSIRPIVPWVYGQVLASLFFYVHYYRQLLQLLCSWYCLSFWRLSSWSGIFVGLTFSIFHYLYCHVWHIQKSSGPLCLSRKDHVGSHPLGRFFHRYLSQLSFKTHFWLLCSIRWSWGRLLPWSPPSEDDDWLPIRCQAAYL